MVIFIGDRDPACLVVQDIHKPPLQNHVKNPAGEESAVSAAFLIGYPFRE
ncbi:MAG: hypothetical protein ACJZ4Z_02055 [Candidatus Thalassarchaeaceae archaeon]